MINKCKNIWLDGWYRIGLQRKNPDAWNLWAGYCMYSYTKIKKSNLYFMYDFANGLDTGGGNYDALYYGYDDRNMDFSSVSQVSINIPSIGVVDDLMLLDDSWYHIGSVFIIRSSLKTSEAPFCLVVNTTLPKLIASSITFENGS